MATHVTLIGGAKTTVQEDVKTAVAMVNVAVKEGHPLVALTGEDGKGLTLKALKVQSIKEV